MATKLFELSIYKGQKPKKYFTIDVLGANGPAGRVHFYDDNRYRYYELTTPDFLKKLGLNLDGTLD